MPTHAGPNIFGEETLVFGYDLADTVNSYIGEPTTNQYTNPDFTNGTTGWSFASWDGNVTYGTDNVLGPFGKTIPVLKLTKNTTSAYSHFHQYNSGKYTTGNQYTLSAWVKGSGTLRGNTQWGGIEQSFSLTGDWQYVKYTVTAPNNDNFPYWAAEALTTGTVMYMVYAQSEQKTHATPFVAGTRSATQGLLPLIGNSTIDLTNVSFDSNAQTVFDGTDDSMVVSNNSALKNNNTSIEFVIKYLDTPNGDIIQFGVGSGAYAQYYYRAYSGNSYWNWYPVGTGYGDITIPNAALPLNQYHHIVMTGNDQGYVQFYINGVVQTGATRTRNTQPSNWTPADLTIGGFSWDGYSSSIIPSVKIYNRVLTASEISRNFNAIKSRFNI
jgi:hypothetical protein